MRSRFLIIFLVLSVLTAVAKKPDTRPHVTIETTMGEFVVVLYKETPIHRENFIRLCREGFYDGILFHRVIKDFMIQAGDPESREAKPGQLLGDGDVDYTLPAEIHSHLYHKRGALAAARESDDVNPEFRSSGAQFYVVWGRSYDGTPHLDGSYTVFGEVIKGLDVIGRIQRVKTDRNDRPREDVRIIRTIVNE